MIPLDDSDFVVDAGSGNQKVWYNNIPTDNKDDVEIEDGRDFLLYDKKVDWVSGNPPFDKIIDFIFKSSEISRKGFAFVMGPNRINQLTPVRLDKLAAKGFFINRIHIFTVKKWFGRYYFLIWTREKSKDITWCRTNYVDK